VCSGLFWEVSPCWFKLSVLYYFCFSLSWISSNWFWKIKEEREVGGFIEREKSSFGKKSEGINENKTSCRLFLSLTSGFCAYSH